ncbi:hypothetical protein [Kangiella sp. TOML190]|uniref:hypothetical protein n=1 Tax=Kangiella sp. TOML190 TaxID=2931351 RepID=UPI00203A6F32|nr:hypothetical protein [Kangiella sp. TOML190]
MRILFILGFITLLPACDMCGNQIISETPSPDLRQKIVVFERSCGATTGFSNHISILDINEELANEPGNIFIADGHHDENLPKVIWKSEDQLEISYTNNGDVYKKESSLKDVAILFSAL